MIKMKNLNQLKLLQYKFNKTVKQLYLSLFMLLLNYKTIQLC